MSKPLTTSTSPIRIAVDAVIFTVQKGELKALLIQMKKKPFEGQWAFPGGVIEAKETTEEAARRILTAQTGVQDVYLEQLMTFDDLARDPLGRVISVAYYALMLSNDVKLKTSEKYLDVRWWSAKKLPKLAYDHAHIAKVALQRIRAKLEYTNIAWSVLPKTFSLTELQNVYEAILDRPLDKRNFRKKILALKLLKETGKKQTGSANRPAMLYEFRQRKPVIINLF